MKTRSLMIIGMCILIALAVLSVALFSLRLQFDGIKEDMEQTGYDICEIRLEENKIIIDLNRIFEGTEHEKKIMSKIPSYFDYEVVYHEGYTDYFINTITVHECEPLEKPLTGLNDFNERVQKYEK